MGIDDKNRFRLLYTAAFDNDEAPPVCASIWTDGDSVVELIYLRSRRILSARIEASSARYRTDSAEVSPELAMALMEDAREWAERLPELSDVSVSPAFIRDLRLGELLNGELEVQARADSARAGLDEPKPIVIGNTDIANAFGFDTIKQLNANLRMVTASVHYARITESGVARPMAAVAKSLDCSESAARALITRARSEGYLTPGERGKPGGKLTDKAENLLKAISQ